jgi:hypothetical protein
MIRRSKKVIEAEEEKKEAQRKFDDIKDEKIRLSHMVENLNGQIKELEMIRDREKSNSEILGNLFDSGIIDEAGNMINQ